MTLHGSRANPAAPGGGAIPASPRSPLAGARSAAGSGSPEILPTDDLTATERHELIASMKPDDAERVPEPHEVEVPDDLREEIETAMGRYPELRSASIPALWAVQRRYGWCPPEGIRQAAAVMGLTPADLQAVASFYDLFHLTPSGRHRVLVCTNISCWMRGGDELLESFCAAAGCDALEASHGGSSSAGGEVFVSGFECLGACDMAPMASIDGRYYGPLDGGDATTVIDQLRSGEEPVPERAMTKRPLVGGSGEERFRFEYGGRDA
jgi:NADH-quinone oxidoreductase subunit E